MQLRARSARAAKDVAEGDLALLELFADLAGRDGRRFHGRQSNIETRRLVSVPAGTGRALTLVGTLLLEERLQRGEVDVLTPRAPFLVGPEVVRGVSGPVVDR